jgi:pre-mRNA-splicing factor ISY1
LYNRFPRAIEFLPGVKELFDKLLEKKRRSRHEIYKRVNTNYYGYRDDKDGILEKFEWPT